MEARKKLESLLDAIDFKNIQYKRYIEHLNLDYEDTGVWLQKHYALRKENQDFCFNVILGKNYFRVDGFTVPEEEYESKYPDKFDRWKQLKLILKNEHRSANYSYYKIYRDKLYKLIKDDYAKGKLEFEKWYESLLVRFSSHLVKAGAILDKLSLKIVKQNELLVSDTIKEIHARFIYAGGDRVCRHVRYILTTRKNKK